MRLVQVAVFLGVALTALTPASFAAAGKITGVHGQKQVQRMTGPGITSAPYNISGTDLGIPIYHNSKTYFLFGDTFSSDTSNPGTDWRRNTIAWSTDTTPSDGITLGSWAVDGTGAAKQVFSSNIPSNVVTNIPTGGLSVNGSLYVWFMNVIQWGPAGGEWYISQAELAKWSDSTSSFTVVPSSTFSGSGNFGMVAAREGVNGDPYIYLWGTPSGRFGGVKLARFLPSQIENRAAYQFYDGTVNGVPQWTSDEFAADIIIPAPVGEMSVMYNQAVGAWTILYFDENTDKVMIRQADNPWGPWSAPVTVLTSSQAPGLYAPFMLPQWVENNGETIYYTLSIWATYDVYLLKTVMNIAPVGSISISNGASYTNSTAVTLSLPATDNSGSVAQMQISNDGVFDTEPWGTYSPTKAWTLPGGDGMKTVYVKYRDASNYESDVFSDSIVLDTTPPGITSVAVSPTMVATGNKVHVSVSAADANGVGSVVADSATNLSKVGATWQGDILAGGMGTHSVRIDATDAAGNLTTYYSSGYTTAPVVATAVRSLADSAAASAAGRYLFKAWGKVTLITGSTLGLADGSGSITINCPGYSGVSSGDYVTATGVLMPGAAPTLLVQPENFKKVSN